MRKRPSAFVRAVLILTAIGYFGSTMLIAPLLFVWAGLTVDSNHLARIENVDGAIRVTLAHDRQLLGNTHKHEWLSQIVANDKSEGHPDHVAVFAGSDTGTVGEAGEKTLECPVRELSDFVWNEVLAVARFALSESPLRLDGIESLASRATRPVVLLI